MIATTGHNWAQPKTTGHNWRSNFYRRPTASRKGARTWLHGCLPQPFCNSCVAGILAISNAFVLSNWEALQNPHTNSRGCNFEGPGWAGTTTAMPLQEANGACTDLIACTAYAMLTSASRAQTPHGRGPPCLHPDAITKKHQPPQRCTALRHHLALTNRSLQAQLRWCLGLVAIKLWSAGGRPARIPPSLPQSDCGVSVRHRQQHAMPSRMNCSAGPPGHTPQLATTIAWPALGWLAHGAADERTKLPASCALQRGRG